MLRICQECGIEFEGTHNQKICKADHYRPCPVCSKPVLVNPRGTKYVTPCCSRKCAVQRQKDGNSNQRTPKLCKLCNESFIPNTNSQLICDKDHYRSCHVCGSSIPVNIPSQELGCCSNECSVILRQQTMEDRHGVKHALQSGKIQLKYESTSLINHGVRRPMQSQEVKDKHGNTCESRYGVRIPFHIKGFRTKSIATSIRKYGVNHHTQRSEYHTITENTCRARYGTKFPMHNPDIRSKAARGLGKRSSLESRLHDFLDNYNIKYIKDYTLNDTGCVHAFDVYLPDYKILIDTDGVFWHSYLSDPDGAKVRDDLDPVRLHLVPNDHIFHLIIESDYERGLKDLQGILKSIDSNIFDYDSDLFRWCRSMEFPYYNYTADRMIKDYTNLCKYQFPTYNPNCRIGISIVNNFHRSIFDAHVGNKLSIKDAWYDDKLLKKVIANRLIYKNDVQPSKILAGFNITKIAPKVSVFNPVLAKYLTLKYLSQFDEVFDPFSGFSGRLLGVSATGKRYIGQDLSGTHIEESNDIIQLLSLNNATMYQRDIIYDIDSTYQSLLTCPPYNTKEVYGGEVEFNSCDDWIDICMSKYTCNKYVFVVDKTDKYNQFIVEILENRSHFGNSTEYVVVIE